MEVADFEVAALFRRSVGGFFACGKAREISDRGLLRIQARPLLSLDRSDGRWQASPQRYMNVVQQGVVPRVRHVECQSRIVEGPGASVERSGRRFDRLALSGQLVKESLFAGQGFAFREPVPVEVPVQVSSTLVVAVDQPSLP